MSEVQIEEIKPQNMKLVFLIPCKFRHVLPRFNKKGIVKQ